MSTLQTRLQMGLVERLEEQLAEEKIKLSAMFNHIRETTAMESINSRQI